MSEENLRLAEEMIQCVSEVIILYQGSGGVFGC